MNLFVLTDFVHSHSYSIVYIIKTKKSTSNKMGKFDFLKDALPYIEKKAQSFMEENGLKNNLDFNSFMKNEMSKGFCFCSSISSFLNEVVSRVADATGKNPNDVYDDFCKHYLS